MRYRKLRRKSSVFLGQNQGIWGYRHGQATAVPGKKTELQSLATAYPTCRIVVLLPPYMQDRGTATTLHAGSWYCYHPTCRILVLLPPYSHISYIQSTNIFTDFSRHAAKPPFLSSLHKILHCTLHDVNSGAEG
jgi:hypothetical protein